MLDIQSFSWTQAAVVSSAGFLLWTVGLAVYRLYFHPLASFPGPKIAAVTQWYEFYYDILHGEGGQYTFKVDEMHKKYGPIVRVNPQELHVIDPEWHETLYGGPGQIRDKYPPAAAMAGVTMGSFGTIQHHQHRQRRAAITSLFSKKTVHSYEALVRGHVEELCQLIEKQCAVHGLTELRATYLAYSTDVVCDYFFGKPVGLLEDEIAAVEWKETIEALAFFTPYAKQLTWLIPTAKRLPVPLVAVFSRALAQAVDIFNDMNRRAKIAYQSFNGNGGIAEKESKPAFDQSPRPPTVWNEILSSRLPDSEKLPFRMAEEGVVVIAAGSETVARTLNTATFHLLDTPRTAKALQAELMAAIPDSRNVPTIKELEQLPYLTAVIKESLRMSCITMSRLPIISPQQPLQYKEWTIPAGTPVGMTPHKILMDPTIYTSPMEFRPERWLGSKEEVQRLNHFHVPFGKGNRICLGINVAQAELHLALATLFRRYEFELVDTIRERDVDAVRDCFVGEPSLKNQGIKIRITAQV